MTKTAHGAPAPAPPVISHSTGSRRDCLVIVNKGPRPEVRGYRRREKKDDVEKETERKEREMGSGTWRGEQTARGAGSREVTGNSEREVRRRWNGVRIEVAAPERGAGGGGPCSMTL